MRLSINALAPFLITPLAFSGRDVSLPPSERVAYTEMHCVVAAAEPLSWSQPSAVSARRIMDTHAHVKPEKKEIEVEPDAGAPVDGNAFAEVAPGE